MANSNLLIIHQGALGDVVLTFPAIIALRQKFRCIDLICQGQLGKLASHLGLVEKSYPLEAAYFATLFSDPMDAGIRDLLGNYARILVFSFSVDLEKAINQNIDRPCLRVNPRPPARERIHVADFLIQRIEAGGLIETADAGDAVSGWHRKQTHRAHSSIDRSKIIIHPGSGSIRKCWPLTSFLELAQRLEKRGLQPQFVCGPAEPHLIQEIRNRGRKVHIFSELTNLVDWLESAGEYIGNDSGVSHLAAFLGLPSVVIFGPADPVRWKPPGPRVRIVRPELDCHPCFEIEPDNCTQPACLTDANLESVLAAFDEVLKG
ncbi:MAG: glycosyltransferase family 9 protein [Deltaproteobacteria bacterium]|jgi:ADP-heptose:LPS heptosyltransferase|nr:glycosyltransferase family 9 protein [Deltaproteobacteria bacterium]